MPDNGLTAQVKAHAAAVRHGLPARGLQVIAVAGRDGAGATIAFLAEIIKAAGERVGVIAQDYIEIAGERAPGSNQAQPLEDAFKLHGLLAQMRAAKCSFVLLEIAGPLPSHHFAGIPFGALIVRRITDDRLDQVSNTAAIMQVKKLARHTKGFMVLPRDDSGYDEIRPLATAEAVLSFGTHPSADSRITKVQLHPKGSAVSLTIDHQTELNLASHHATKQATYNITAAATAAYMLHVPLETIEEAITKLPALPLVSEYLQVDRPYKIVLDGSVTPQGIAETLESLKHFAKNRLIAVLAANLSQPAAWRPVVGEVVADIADRVVVTDGDYDASENPQLVRAQFLEGVSRAGAEAATEEVSDRQAGIEKALSFARRGDTIVLCCGTTRPYLQAGSDHKEWSDRATINELV